MILEAKEGIRMERPDQPDKGKEDTEDRNQNKGQKMMDIGEDTSCEAEDNVEQGQS